MKISYTDFLKFDLGYFIKGALWLSSSTLITAIGGIFLSVLFAKFLSAEQFGQFSFVNSALAFLTLTAMPGMGQAVTQAAAENKDGFYMQATFITLKWSFIGAFVFFLGAIYFLNTSKVTLSIACMFAGVAFPLTTGFNLYSSFLSGKKLFKKLALYSTISIYCSIIATGFALWKIPSTSTVVFFSVFSTAIANLVLTFFTFKEIGNNRLSNEHVNLGKHLSFSQVFTIGADYFDRFLIPIYLGFSNNAIYAFAILIPMQIHGVLKAFIVLGQPKVAFLPQNTVKRSLIIKSLQFELLVAIIVIGYIVLAPALFSVFYPQYQGQALLLSQLFSLSLLYFPGNILALLFLREKNAGAIYKVNIIYAIATVILILALVPSFGLIGAVIARIIIRFIQLTTQLALFIKLEVKETRLS